MWLIALLDKIQRLSFSSSGSLSRVGKGGNESRFHIVRRRLLSAGRSPEHPCGEVLPVCRQGGKWGSPLRSLWSRRKGRGSTILVIRQRWMQERNSIHFSLHREIPDEKANRSTCRLFMPSSRWLSIRFLGSRSPWQAPLFPGLSAVLQDVGNQYVAECLYFGKSYHILLGKVTNGNLPLEHNTTLPFNIYSFALASIFLRGRTYFPVLTHLVCRLNGGRERLTERHLEGRKKKQKSY